MKKNFKQHRDKADKWYEVKPVDERVPAARAEGLKDLGFWARNEVIYDFARYGVDLYANDRDFFFMHPINGWMSKLIDDKRFIPILFRSVPHLVPRLAIGIEDGEAKFVLRDGIPQDFAPDLRRLFRRELSEFGSLFLKPAGLSGGRGAFSFEAGQMDHAVAQIDVKHAYIVNEQVRNEEYSQSINPYGTNTIRAYFFRPIGQPRQRLFRAFHRFGTKSSAPADNLSRGGVVSEIDIKDGRLYEVVAPSHKKTRSRIHPESQKLIEGRMVPGWPEKLDQIREMLDALFFLDFGALDMAATPTGLKVLEVNSQPERRMLQIMRPAFLDKEFAEFCRRKNYGQQL